MAKHFAHANAVLGVSLPADYFNPPDGPNGPVLEVIAFVPHHRNQTVAEADKVYFFRPTKGDPWYCISRSHGKKSNSSLTFCKKRSHSFPR